MKLRAIALFLVVIMAAATAFTAEQYISDVQNDKITVCKYVKLAVKRHVDDLERSKKEDFPYIFNPEEAKRKIIFTQELGHIEGEWARRKQKIKLEPWQQFIDWALFGWRKKSDGTRRFSTAYIEVARKNGKTLEMAAAGNYCFLMEKEAGAQVYFCATKKDQAKIGWNAARLLIEKHPYLKTLCRTYKQNSTVVLKGTESFMRPVGKDSDTEDGLNPHFVGVDERHAHKDSELVNVMESGMGARGNPLMYVITTAGFDKNLPCYQEDRTLVENILERNIDPIPEEVFGIIFTLDEDDDWTDENVWAKSNPNIGVSIKWDFLRKRVQKALVQPALQNDVKTKNLNIWTQAVSRWINSEAWKACNFTVDEEKLLGRPCYGAFDLSTNLDITAWTLCFPPEGDETRYQFLFRFFMPEENLLERQRADKVPYLHWQEKGLLFATPGNVVDYDFVEEQIKQDAEKFNLIEYAYDPWNATQVNNHLVDAGFVAVPFRQGFISMSGPSKDFEKRILSKELAHSDNPIMTWMISCTEVKQDPAGNVKPVKPDRKKSGKRIDGVITAIMSLDRAVNGAGASVYESRGMLIV